MVLTLVLLTWVDGAEAEPIAKGHTGIAVSRNLVLKLKRKGIALSRIGGAGGSGRVVSLSIDGGDLDLSSGQGTVEHEGGLRFAVGARSVSLTGLGLDSSKRVLRGRIDGRRAVLARLGNIGTGRFGFADTIWVGRVWMTAKLASKLNRGLGLGNFFAAGRPFATISTTAHPLYDKIARGSLELSLDPGTLAKLKAANVVPAPFEAAVLSNEPPTYAASLVNGAIYPDLRGGFAGVEAGLRLVRESSWATISWVGLSLSLESNRLTADSSLATDAGNDPRGVGPIAELDLSGATVRVDAEDRAVTITGARAILEASAAALINEAFAATPGQQVVAAGDPLGTLALKMTGR